MFAAGGLAAVLFLSCKADSPAQKESETPANASTGVSRAKDGDPLLTLGKAAQERIGLQVQALAMQTLQPEIVAYGRLEEDPSQSFVLRAPVTGILLLPQEGSWPNIGRRLASGTIVGMIEPRFTPSDRIALSGQLTMARSEVNTNTAEVAAARAAYERLRLLNADQKNVSDRVVEEALARLRAGEAKLKAATDTVSLIESSLHSAGLAEHQPLVLPSEGDVVEVMAHPGEAIESGSPVVRVTRLDRLLARVDVPVGQFVPSDVSAARILPIGYEGRFIHAERIAVTAAVDPKVQGQSFLFQLHESRFGLRPGLAVTAYLTIPGAPRQGVVISRPAIVRHGGSTFVYIQTSADQFVRKEISMTDPVAGGYFTAVNFAPGDRVVVVGAQLLLSEEFKAQTQTEKEGS
jgi:biotin carboxyl carrier protein